MASIDGKTGALAASVGNGDITAHLNGTVLPVYSDKILQYALPQLVVLQFAKRQLELQRMAGDTIVMHRFAPIKRGGKLTEGIPIVSKTLDHSTTSITVDEYGNAIGVSERLRLTSALDPLEQAARELAVDYAIMTNVEQVKVLRSMPNVIYANEKANRAALVSTDGLSTRTIRAATEKAATNKIPKINLFRMEGMEAVPTGGQAYVCLVHPHQARSLKEDPDWKKPHEYVDTRHIYYGEIGMYDNVIFIETTLVPMIDTTGDVYIDSLNYTDDVDNPIAQDGAPAAFDLYQAFFIGDYLWGFASALPVQMRDKSPEDFGRIRDVAHYSIQGQGLINEDHGFILETA